MYKVVFYDGDVFEGGKISDSKWNNIADKEIKRLDYWLGGKCLILSDYEAYNHLVERKRAMNGEEKITKLYLMGKNKNNVERFIYDFKTNKLTEDVVEFGKEFNDKSANGWKQGTKDLKPSHQIL